MKRSSSLRKAIFALVVLATFMVILRISRPTAGDPITPQAASVVNKPMDESAAGINQIYNEDVLMDTNEANERTKPIGEAHDVERPRENGQRGNSDKPKVESEIKQSEREAKKGANDHKKGKISSEEPRELEFDAAAVYKKIVESPDSPPVIIFSKSYCPHSTRAKSSLLDAHIINPRPRVVELDIMDHGLDLQAYLGELTGRRTVPNILVNGVSRGGASDIADLGDELVSNFLKWGNGKSSIAVQEPALE